MPSRRSYLFLYGTLLDPVLRTRLAGRSVPVTQATLHGWQRVALPDLKYPTLRKGKGSVEGALATVTAPVLHRLAAYEGPRYRLVPVVVRTARGDIAAHAWIAPGRASRPWP